MNNSISQNIKDLDIIGLLSLFLQTINKEDNAQQKIINKLILQAVSNEINKLHNENNNIIKELTKVDEDEKLIIKQLKEIVDILERRL